MNWEKHGIDISKLRGGKTICPQCSHTRKNKTEPCLSVNKDMGLFNCHNCEFKGTAKEFAPKKEYTQPLARLEKVSKKVIDWFDGRGISNNTLLRFGITEAKEWMPASQTEMACICFNYYRDDKLVNIKFRDAKKGFKLSKDAELTFYNIDAIKGEDACIIVEGEIDCLSLHEAGIYNAVSVPNGASKGSQKLEYLDNCWTYFENKTKIILAVDNDEAGNSLRDELARRLGKEKCFTVAYPEGCKDFNDVLVKHGKQEVNKVIELAQDIPLEGIMSMDEMYPQIQDWYLNGYPKGAAANIKGFDELLTFAPGQLTMLTGIPGHGKDEFGNWLMVNLARYENWTWGICGFEETPAQTATKLMEKYVGKSFDFRLDPANRINTEEGENSIAFVDKYFRFIKTDDVQTDVDGILIKAEEMVKRYGIKGFCLNPWNWVDHYREPFMSETEYVSAALTKIISFAKKFQVHFILVAHTTKMVKDKATGKYEVPTLYSISGSANFFNKTHNGLTIYRDTQTGIVDVYTQKVKQSWLGKIGYCSFTYDTFTRQYNTIHK